MGESAIIALVVAVAALWVGWTLVLPVKTRRAILRKLGRKGKAGGCDDCGN